MYPRTGFKSYVRGFTAITATSLTTTGDVTIAGRTTSAGFSSSIAGSQATPAFNWSTDPDNGLYYSGASNRWELVAGATDVYSVRTALAVAYVPFSASSTVNIAGIVTLGAASYLVLTETTAPGAAAANTVRIYAVEDGGLKTDLAAIFQSGSAQAVSGEP